MTSTQRCLSMKFVSKTDAVKLIITLRCCNPSLDATTCLPPMHTRGSNTDHFQPLMDQIGVRRGLIGFSALFDIELASRNPIHVTSVITSDHCFVTAYFSLKLRMRKSHSKQIDWFSVTTPDICSIFVTDVCQEIDSDFQSAVHQASMRHLSLKFHY